MVVKHSTSRAWDAAVDELNRTTTIHRSAPLGAGNARSAGSAATSASVTFTVPLKASAKLSSNGVAADKACCCRYLGLCERWNQVVQVARVLHLGGIILLTQLR